LPSGQISYHIPEKHYLDFPAEPLLKAPEWDGHTSKEVVFRLRSFWDDSISDLFFDAIKFFGKDEQVQKAIEELAELIRALSRKDKENITEEMADVRIMLAQLEMIYNNKSGVNKVMKEKRNRLYRRVHGKQTLEL
jgi:NTP pyrophosphatase (non-canonical NTP hydrolase)